MSNYLDLFKGKKVLITGHTGFKGSWLGIWLSRLGADVVGVSDRVPTSPSHFTVAGLSDFITDERLDIRDRSGLKALVQKTKPDFVFHLAAQALVRSSYQDPAETWEINTLGTLSILDAFREHPDPCTLIMITSDKCYDNVEWVWGYKETDRLGGPDPYSGSKGAAELVIRSYLKSYFPDDGAVRIGIGRAGNVIGGGDWAEDRVVPDCMRAWANGAEVELRNPSATRPWQHVLEPLSGYINLAVELAKSGRLHGEPFNFGPMGNGDQSVGSLVDGMSKHWQGARWKDLSADREGPYESSLLKLNCDKALHLLNWHAVWSFERTLEETVSWYRDFYLPSDNTIISVSEHQIDLYMRSAKELGLPWAL